MKPVIDWDDVFKMIEQKKEEEKRGKCRKGV